MLSGMFAGIAGRLSARYGGPYHAGNVVVAGAATYDDGGSILLPAADTRTSCSVQVDAATEAMRQADGFTERDVRLLVLPCGIEIATGMQVEVTEGADAGAYRVEAVARDPGGIGWELRGRRV